MRDAPFSSQTCTITSIDTRLICLFFTNRARLRFFSESRRVTTTDETPSTFARFSQEDFAEVSGVRVEVYSRPLWSSLTEDVISSGTSPRAYTRPAITVHTVFLFDKYVRAKCNCDAFALRRARVCELRLTVNRYLVLVATPSLWPSDGTRKWRDVRGSTQAPACLAAKRNRAAAFTPQLT